MSEETEQQKEVRSVIFENDTYEVVLGEIFLFKDITGAACYNVVNKQYGVVEIQELQLPRAVAYADKLNEDLREALKQDEIPNNVVTLP